MLSNMDEIDFYEALGTVSCGRSPHPWIEYEMTFPRILALGCLIALSGCGSSKTDMLRVHAWACGNETKVVFGADGVMSTFQGKAHPTEFQSRYKIVESKTDMSMSLELGDDNATRPIFGGSGSLTPLQVGFADGFLLVSARGFPDDHPCEAIKEEH